MSSIKVVGKQQHEEGEVEEEQFNLDDTLNTYNKYLLSLAKEEILKARNKKSLFRVATMAVKFNGSFPWQFVKLSSQIEDVIQNKPLYG